MNADYPPLRQATPIEQRLTSLSRPCSGPRHADMPRLFIETAPFRGGSGALKSVNA